MYVYSTPIPTPNCETLQKLANIRYKGEAIAVYWRRESRQAIVTMPDGTSYLSPDARIVRVLAHILGWNPGDVKLTNLFLFELPKHGYAADKQMSDAIYLCDWSDYASDRIVFECTLTC
jgi:hypothetical protein